MIPVMIETCTGWLHTPAPGVQTKRGVVLCTSLGNEACILYRPLVVIADMLTRHGLTVLRFDYPGTGDSLEEEDAEVGADDIIRSIVDAAEWLRREAGVEEVALCGIRAGALLAGAAARLVPDLWGLALMATPGSGRVFLREMLMTARAWDAMWLVEGPSETDGWFEAHGIRMTHAAKKSLEAIDLRRLSEPPALRVLVMEPATARNVGGLPERLQALGSDVTEIAFAGYEALLKDALENEVPVEAAQALGRWLAAGAALADEPPPRIASAPARRTHSGAVESTVQFGPGGELAGVLTKPRGGEIRSGALIVNTGAHPHTGHSRFSVTLARRLAQAGVATLRMDASGLGDAAVETGHRTDVYSDSHMADVHAGFRWLHNEIGRPLVVLGLCSGAYSAVRLWDEPELAGLVLVNLQKFFFDPGVPLKVVQTNTKRTTQFYMRNIGRSKTWRRILTGDIDVGGISRELAGRGLRRARSAADPLLAKAGVRSRYAQVRHWFRQLSQRRVPVGYVLSANDPGWDELEEYFGASGARLRRMPNIVLRRLENADHTLSHRCAREDLFAVVLRVVEAAEGASATAEERAAALAA